MLEKDFELFWEIYEDSFPEDEKRDKNGQLKIMNKEEYNIEFYREESIIGFITYWHIGDYTYIDHLAIKNEHRGKGYGTKLLDMIKRKGNKFILEVEPPINKTNKKRIRFYEKNGFYLNEYDYIQRPLKKNGKTVKLELMTYPKRENKEKLLEIDNKLKTIVYKLK